jgi:ferredoxin
MVKVKRKPFEEIMGYLERYNKILNIGCGGCASVCFGGGMREVNILNEEIRLYFQKNGINKKIDGYTVERACNEKCFLNLEDIIKEGGYDCIITMCCSAGSQLIAEKFSRIPLYPAVNTVAIGIDRDLGLYEERCRACGDCIIGYTGGICPVTRCAKGLFNGPCGGTNKGMCEVNPNIPCAWYEIYNRLKEQNRLEDILKIHPPVEWKNQIQRTIVQYGFEDRYIK